MKPRIVYTTNWLDQTVTIDYDQTLRLFLTDKEYRPFSAERLLQMLNEHANTKRIDTWHGGPYRITAGDVLCVLTQHATSILSYQYRQRSDWQTEYPYVAHLL